MSSAYENGGILGKTLDYRSTTTTSFEDETASAANCEVIETRSVNFSTLTGADDVNIGIGGSSSLSSTLQAGDIVVVTMFLDAGNFSGLDDSGSSWVYPSGFPSGASENISNINMLLAYKVVTSGNETLDATIGFAAVSGLGGAAIVVLRGGTVSSSVGGAVDIQAGYNAENSASTVSFPSLSGAPSGSVALLFAFLDDDQGESITSAPSGYTTAENFPVGTSTGNGGRFYAGYQEDVTATGSPSIEFSSADSMIGISLLISRDIAGRTAKTNSGIWNTEAVYDDNAFDAVSATTRSVTGVSVIGNKSVYLSSDDGDPISNTITVTTDASIYSGHQTLVAMIHAESDTGTITEPTVTGAATELTYNGSVEDDNVGARTSTFTNLPIGNYDNNRIVYLLFSTDFEDENAGNDITGVTVDGQPATEIFVQVANPSDNRWWGSMWKFANTTGTTANVVITAAAGGRPFDYNVVSSYSAYGYKDTVEQTVLHYQGAGGAAGVQDGDVTVTATDGSSMILGLAIGNAQDAFNFTSTDATITTDKIGTVSGDTQEHASAELVAAGDVVITDSLTSTSHNSWLKAFIVVSPGTEFGTTVTKDASIIGGSSNNIHTGIYRTNTAQRATAFNFQYDNAVENVGINVYEVGPATITSTGAADIVSQPAFITSNAVSGATGSGLSATLNGITTNNAVALVSGYMDHSNSSTNSTFSTTSGTLTEIDGIYNANSSLNLGQGDFGIVTKPAVSGVTIDYTSDIDNPNGVLAAAIYGSSQETPNAGTVTALNDYISDADIIPLAVLDDWGIYDTTATSSRTIDISSGSGDILLFTVSIRYNQGGTPVANIQSTATNYTVLDNSTASYNFLGPISEKTELADVTGSTSVTAQINNSGGAGISVNYAAAVAIQGLSSSATINDDQRNFSDLATTTDTISVVAGGLLVIYVRDGSSQTVSEDTSLLGTITEFTNNLTSGHKFYTAPVNSTGTATIRAVQTGGTYEGMWLWSIAP